MKIIHFESGLGNQMFNYAEYLAIKISNPGQKIYIETIIYEIKQCNDVICQWNGYELERVFNLKLPNIKDLFDENEWDALLKRVTVSEFWQNDWNYDQVIGEELRKKFGDLDIVCKSFGYGKKAGSISRLKKYIFTKTFIGYHFKRIFLKMFCKTIERSKSNQDLLYFHNDRNQYLGHTLLFQYKYNGIEKIDSELRNAFRFPELTDVKNQDTAAYIQSVESVAIHARRGDFLSGNSHHYEYGYFKRAVCYIRYHIANPIFFIFCDPGSIDWCRQNEKIFGLDHKVDKIIYVDWNYSNDSYKDLQLMSMCKHNIITNSSFGWWGAYLNSNPQKITCSPDVRINTSTFV